MNPIAEPKQTVDIASHTCTIRDRRLANAVLVGLIGSATAAALWLVSAILAGPWLADTVLVEAAVAGITVLAFALMAWSLSRGLGCGRCHTPQCRCT